MKLIFIDVETSGLDHTKNALLQCAGIIRIDGRIKDKFNFKMQPHADAVMDVNSEMASRHRLKQSTGFNKFINKIEKYVNPYKKSDKFYFLGYNSRFDENFIRAWFLRNENKWYGSYFHNPSVDIMQLAMRCMMRKGERSNLKNMKLSPLSSIE